MEDSLSPWVRAVLVTGTDSPVNIDSFTMHVPATKTASHDIKHPFEGISMTSPGTRLVDSISSDNSESSKESDKIISEHDSAYEFEKHLVEVIQEIKDPNNPRNPRNTAHEKIQSLESAMVKFIKDSQKSAHASSQEHGVHENAVDLISHVYPCINILQFTTFLN